MRLETLDWLRCCFCGGRLAPAEDATLERAGDDIVSGILYCGCCVYPVVGGISVLHLGAQAQEAREQIVAGNRSGALLTMLELEGDRRAAFTALQARGEAATFREAIALLCDDAEGPYLFHRFSDPTYLVGAAVVRAVAQGAAGTGGRVIDVCGGAGHLTRALAEVTAETPAITDLVFFKLWLDRTFTVPGCEAICCDANNPLPLARHAFAMVVCSDAFHYVWARRLLAEELIRLVAPHGALAMAHLHNANCYNISAGMPLSPAAYAELFHELAPALFGDAALFDGLVQGRGLDLSAGTSGEGLDAEATVTLVAGRRPDAFRAFPEAGAPLRRGVRRLNPLYTVERRGSEAMLTLMFPSAFYEDEYGACTRYLPRTLTLPSALLSRIEAGEVAPDTDDLVRRRIVLNLPERYC